MYRKEKGREGKKARKEKEERKKVNLGELEWGRHWGKARTPLGLQVSRGSNWLSKVVPRVVDCTIITNLTIMVTMCQAL